MSRQYALHFAVVALRLWGSIYLEALRATWGTSSSDPFQGVRLSGFLQPISDALSLRRSSRFLIAASFM